MSSFINTINFNSATITKNEYRFLSNFLKEKKVKYVLEFGPGVSTYCFIDNNCTIISIECDTKWYEKYKETFKEYQNVTVLYNDFRKKGFINIEEIDNKKKYDIVFVDSPPAQAPFARLNTLLYAFEKSNVIIIHDYKRYAEQNSIILLKKIYKFNIESLDEDKGIGILTIKKK